MYMFFVTVVPTMSLADVHVCKCIYILINVDTLKIVYVGVAMFSRSHTHTHTHTHTHSRGWTASTLCLGGWHVAWRFARRSVKWKYTPRPTNPTKTSKSWMSLWNSSCCNLCFLSPYNSINYFVHSSSTFKFLSPLVQDKCMCKELCMLCSECFYQLYMWMKKTKASNHLTAFLA